MNQQEWADADRPDQQADDAGNCRIGRHRAEPWRPAAAQESDRQAMLQQEQIGRSDAEHHQRVPVQAVADAAQARQSQIFAHRQGVDVSDSAPVEITGIGVVDGVGAAPEIVRRKGQHADDASNPVVGDSMTKECAMAAIVLDHEQPHQQAGGRHRQQQAEPISEVECRPHQGPEQDQWHNRDDQFDHAAAAARLTVTRQNARPQPSVGDGSGRLGCTAIGVLQDYDPRLAPLALIGRAARS